MHAIGAAILLSLALFKIMDLFEDFVPKLTKLHTLLTMAIGIAAMVAMDYSVFGGLGVSFRETWMGPWATGFVVAAGTTVWQTLFHFLGSSEGDAPEIRHPLRRAA